MSEPDRTAPDQTELDQTAPDQLAARAPDHGASAERTRLAWRRTGLSASAVALIAARPAFVPGAGTTTMLVTALTLISWAALIAIAYRRARRLDAHPSRSGRRTITACALITLMLALVGGLVVTR